jgi:hypothetical protein
MNYKKTWKTKDNRSMLQDTTEILTVYVQVPSSRCFPK